MSNRSMQPAAPQPQQASRGKIRLTYLIFIGALLSLIVSVCYGAYTTHQRLESQLPHPNLETVVKDLRQYHQQTGRFPRDFSELDERLWRREKRERISNNGKSLFSPSGNYHYTLHTVASGRACIWAVPVGARAASFADLGLSELSAPHSPCASLQLSTEIQSPVLVGLRRPVILLPASITEWTSVAERHAIIRHELAHLRRRDSYVLVFQSLLGAIFFFHPAVRYALKQLSVEREMACDEAVVSSGVNTTLYADTLLKVAERTLSPQYEMEAMRFASKRTLERRLHGIMNNAFLDSRRRWVFIALPLLLLFTAGWFIGSARAVQMSREEGEIREFLRQVAEIEVRRDSEAFDRLAAPEFIRIGANGEVWNKEQTLAYGRAPRNSTVQSVERRDETIRIYGDTAIVTGLGIARMREAAGREFVVRNLCTFVLVKRDGRWLCVSVQQTRQP